jgi:hypothetical protein
MIVIDSIETLGGIVVVVIIIATIAVQSFRFFFIINARWRSRCFELLLFQPRVCIIA